MAKQPTRIEPWLVLPVPLGNAIQIGGLVGGALLARQAARRAPHGAWGLYAGRLLSYFCEHAFAHYLVGRLAGIRFTSYGVHGSTGADAYPPGLRSIFARLPFLSARVDPASRRAAAPAAQAAMYLAGPLATLVSSAVYPLYGLRRGVPGARALLVGSGLWMAAMLAGEAIHPRSDLRRAWRALRGD